MNSTIEPREKWGDYRGITIADNEIYKMPATIEDESVLDAISDTLKKRGLVA